MRVPFCPILDWGYYVPCPRRASKRCEQRRIRVDIRLGVQQELDHRGIVLPGCGLQRGPPFHLLVDVLPFREERFRRFDITAEGRRDQGAPGTLPRLVVCRRSRRVCFCIGGILPCLRLGKIPFQLRFSVNEVSSDEDACRHGELLVRIVVLQHGSGLADRNATHRDPN